MVSFSGMYSSQGSPTISGQNNLCKSQCLACLYERTGRAVVLSPDVSVGGGSFGVSFSLGVFISKMFKFHIKVFMCWARGCQQSYPVSE